MPPDTFVIFTPDPEDPSWLSGWDPTVEIAEPTQFQDLPQSVFVWRYFQVKVVFRVGGVDLSQSMRVAVSILDFVLMLQAAKATLRLEGSVEIGLSDRGDQWSFSQHRGLVTVRTSGSLGGRRVEGSCPVKEFEQLVDICLTDALRLLVWQQPALRENTYLQTLPSAGPS